MNNMSTQSSYFSSIMSSPNKHRCERFGKSLLLRTPRCRPCAELVSVKRSSISVISSETRYLANHPELASVILNLFQDLKI